MALKTSNKKAVKGFTLVEIIVVLVILAILAAATIPSLLGFIDDAKFKTIDNEARVVRNAAQAYATEQSAGGKTDEFIEGKINGVINSNDALHNLLQNDANGMIFKTEVRNGKIKKFNYTKEIVDYNPEEDFISGKIRYVVFDDTKASLLHATGQITNIDVEDFKATMKNEIKDDLLASLTTDMASVKADLQTDLTSTLTSSLTTDLNSSLESGMNSKISSLKTNFRTELGSNVVDLVYPVGSYYVSHNSTSPATLFGGTWTQITDRFLYCTNSSGVTDGSSTHTHTTGDCTLTIDQIPSHNHRFAHPSWRSSEPLGTNWYFAPPHGDSNTSGTFYSDTENRGGGQAHNHGNTGSSSNMPTVYCWRRTA